MPRGFEVLNGTATNPGASLTALTMNAGDSLAVRSTAPTANIWLLDAWTFTTTNLSMRIRSPRMHDQAQNIRLQPVASLPYPLVGWWGNQRLYSQDNIIVEITGGAAEVDTGALLVYYEDLPGVSARLHYWTEVEPLIANLTSVQVAPQSSGTAGLYGATVALNSSFDTLIRNVDYALLGYECSTTGSSIGIRGADSGNLRVGGPLINRPDLTESWFVQLGLSSGLPCIPVFNAANTGAILIDCTAQATSTTFTVTLHLAELSHSIG